MRVRCVSALMVSAVSFACAAGALAGQDPWADHVVSYQSGVLASTTYTNPQTAVGSPERYTGDAMYNGAVTPMSPPWIEDEIVGVGVGGSLVMRFDEPVVDDPQNPFGIDLLIFGNSGYITDLGEDVTSGSLFSSSSQGLIEVSANGTQWFPIVGVQPDNLYPTLGYVDVTHPFASPAGEVLTDFTRPVNPAFNAAGLSLAQIVAGYDGSGGGAGVDLAGTGLSSISYVRITYLGSSGDLQIDAMSDVSPVPAPAGVLVLGAAGMLAGCRRRRSDHKTNEPCAQAQECVPAAR